MLILEQIKSITCLVLLVCIFCDNYWHKEVLIIVKELCHEIVETVTKFEWNIKITTQNIKRRYN